MEADAAGGVREPQLFTNPLEGVALGDPFVLRHRGRFYLYGTNDGPPLPDGRMIPVFRSDDLIRWESLGGALEPLEPGADHWAPEVLAWNGRFFMVVSFGDVERRGHELWVAVADRPEGPFRLERRVSDPSERFSIDGSWLLDDDGSLYLFRCLDFVAPADLPSGTGIVVQPMRDPFTPLLSPVTVLRAHAPWQVFETNRVMPLYGGQMFARWTTVEGPAPVKRAGRYFCGYSGGNYGRAYGTGEAVADHPLGPYTDPRGEQGPLFATVPGFIEGPGHFSVIQPDLVHDWIVLHGRRPGEPVRRVWLCPASWTTEGVTIGPLTDRPQPRPPLPTVRWRLGDQRPPEPWEAVGGRVEEDPTAGGLRLTASGGGPAIARWRGLHLGGAWVAEVSVRFPDPGSVTAGFHLDSGDPKDAPAVEVLIRTGPGDCVATVGGQEVAASPLPQLGGLTFDFRAFHALEVRAHEGHAEVRVDGVVMVPDLPLPAGARKLGLVTRGSAGSAGSAAVFDGVSVTRID